MLDVVDQHIPQIHHLRLVVDQRQHDNTESILQLRVLEQMVQHDSGVHVVPQLDDDAHALPVRLIAQVGDAFDLLVFDQLRDFLDQVGFVDQIRKLRDDDPAFTVRHRFNIRDGAGDDLAAPGAVSFVRAGCSHDNAAGRKIRRLHDRKDFFDICVPVFFDPVVDDFGRRGDYFAQIVRRNVGRHADRDAGGAVNKQIRVAAGKNRGLFLRLVKVGDKLDRVLLDVRQHLHGNLRQTRLCVSHGRRAVTVDGAEISVAVHQRIAHGPGLGHIDQCAVNRTVAVRMIFTHRIADDTRTFTVRLVRSVVQLCHRVQDSALNRLQAVPHIRKSPLRDDAHRVINIGALHRPLQIHFLNPVKNCIV